MSRILPIAFLTAVFCGCASGGGARWGAAFDTRWPTVRAVEVRVLTCDVYEMHTGEVLEPRADYARDARHQLMLALTSSLETHHRPPPAIASNRSSPSATRPSFAAAFALLDAVAESILTHHYQYGKRRTFEYSIGAAVNDISQDSTADAVLCAELTAAVPSPGRRAFAATALAVGLLTQSFVRVRTQQAALRLMLIDRENGDILAYTLATAEIDVRDADALRRFLTSAARRMLRSNE